MMGSSIHLKTQYEYAITNPPAKHGDYNNPFIFYGPRSASRRIKAADDGVGRVLFRLLEVAIVK